MSRWATFVEIAGISFTGCRATVVDGSGFLSIYGGSVDWANDNTAHQQVFNRGVKGIAFGIQMLSTEISALQDVFDAVETAEAANTTITVKITEGLYDINVLAVPDYSVSPSWVSSGPHSEGWIQDVLMRFISKAAGS